MSTTHPLPHVGDDINVKHPEFYPDTGGDRWYAGIQQPSQRRLDIHYSDRFKHMVCYVPNALHIDEALNEGLRGLKERLDKYGELAYPHRFFHRCIRHEGTVLVRQSSLGCIKIEKKQRDYFFH